MVVELQNTFFFSLRNDIAKMDSDLFMLLILQSFQLQDDSLFHHQFASGIKVPLFFVQFP